MTRRIFPRSTIRPQIDAPLLWRRSPEWITPSRKPSLGSDWQLIVGTALGLVALLIVGLFR